MLAQAIICPDELFSTVYRPTYASAIDTDYRRLMSFMTIIQLESDYSL